MPWREFVVKSYVIVSITRTVASAETPTTLSKLRMRSPWAARPDAGDAVTATARSTPTTAPQRVSLVAAPCTTHRVR